MSVIKMPLSVANYPVVKELDEAVNAIFLKMPELTFEASKTRPYGPDQTDHVYLVKVYAGNQRLGTLAWDRKYVPSQGSYISTYAIKSPRIHKSRGTDRTTKYTKELKSVINIAKQAFVPDSKNSMARYMIDALSSQFRSVMYVGSRDYRNYAERHGREAFNYLVDLIQGVSPTMPPAIMAEVRSEKFKIAHDNCRIIESLEHQLHTVRSGVVIKIERDDTISVANVHSGEMEMEVKSTYDLPKSYQEKFTMLKIMDKSTPIEHVGIKVESEINSEPCLLYYLVGGETVVTH